MNTHPAPEPAPVDVADVQAEAAGLITDLAALVRRVDALIVHRPAEAASRFISPESARAQDELTRVERRARYDTKKRPLGQGWARGYPAATSQSQPPAHTTALSVKAEITFTIADHVRRTQTAAAHAGVCLLLPALPADAGDTDRLAQLRRLVWAAPSRRRLTALIRDLEHLKTTATTYLEGAAVQRMPDPCPHCGLVTLVYDRAAETITCDRDPDTGRHELCQCTDPFCGCALHPITHRHTWHNTAGHARHTWARLASLLALRVRERLDELGLTEDDLRQWARGRRLIKDSSARTAAPVRWDLITTYLDHQAKETRRKTTPSTSTPTTTEEPLS